MISVCMATFNGEQFIRRQLDTVCRCIGSDDEIVISDDGSTDKTVDIIRSYANTDARVRLIKGMHQGVIGNFEAAITEARGDYIFLCDQDDIWKENKVSEVMEVFSRNRSCELVVHDARLVDAKEDVYSETLFSLRGSRAGLVKNLIKNSYVGCCMAFRRSLVTKILPIPRNVEMHDWWIGMVAELFDSPVFIREELINYRRHQANTSGMHHHPVRIMIHNRITLLVELSRRFIRQAKEACR